MSAKNGVKGADSFGLGVLTIRSAVRPFGLLYGGASFETLLLPKPRLALSVPDFRLFRTPHSVHPNPLVSVLNAIFLPESEQIAKWLLNIGLWGVVNMANSDQTDKNCVKQKLVTQT